MFTEGLHLLCVPLAVRSVKSVAITGKLLQFYSRSSSRSVRRMCWTLSSDVPCLLQVKTPLILVSARTHIAKWQQNKDSLSSSCCQLRAPHCCNVSFQSELVSYCAPAAACQYIIILVFALKPLALNDRVHLLL